MSKTNDKLKARVAKLEAKARKVLGDEEVDRIMAEVDSDIAYYEGELAFAYGEALGTNPNPRKNTLYIAWKDGYSDAQTRCPTCTYGNVTDIGCKQTVLPDRGACPRWSDPKTYNL